VRSSEIAQNVSYGHKKVILFFLLRLVMSLKIMLFSLMVTSNLLLSLDGMSQQMISCSSGNVWKECDVEVLQASEMNSRLRLDEERRSEKSTLGHVSLGLHSPLDSEVIVSGEMVFHHQVLYNSGAASFFPLIIPGNMRFDNQGNMLGSLGYTLFYNCFGLAGKCKRESRKSDIIGFIFFLPLFGANMTLARREGDFSMMLHLMGLSFETESREDRWNTLMHAKINLLNYVVSDPSVDGLVGPQGELFYRGMYDFNSLSLGFQIRLLADTSLWQGGYDAKMIAAPSFMRHLQIALGVEGDNRANQNSFQHSLGAQLLFNF
jgi:hypothetical protein